MPAPSLKAVSPPAPKRPTKAVIQQYLDLEDGRKELARQASQLKNEADAIEDQLEAYVRANTKGKTRELVTCGYRLSILSKPGSVAWKSAFIAEVGQERADELEAAAPMKDVFDIAVA